MLEGMEVPRVARMTHDDVPEGMRTDARATWPSPELIESWLGDSIFDLRPGEEVEVPADDEEAVNAARRLKGGDYTKRAEDKARDEELAA